MDANEKVEAPKDAPEMVECKLCGSKVPKGPSVPPELVQEYFEAMIGRVPFGIDYPLFDGRIVVTVGEASSDRKRLRNTVSDHIRKVSEKAPAILVRHLTILDRMDALISIQKIVVQKKRGDVPEEYTVDEGDLRQIVNRAIEILGGASKDDDAGMIDAFNRLEQEISSSYEKLPVDSNVLMDIFGAFSRVYTLVVKEAMSRDFFRRTGLL